MVSAPEILKIFTVLEGLVSITVGKWIATSVLQLGLFRLRARNFQAKYCQEVSADSVFFVLLIFFSNMKGQMQSKWDK